MKLSLIRTTILCITFLTILGLNLKAQEGPLDSYERKETTTTTENKIRMQGGVKYIKTCITSQTDCQGIGNVICTKTASSTECGDETVYTG